MNRLFFLIFSLLLFSAAAAQKRWMTALPDTLALTALSIPGAHDAATSSVHGMGRCQTLTLARQLEAGVRAFDLRPTQRRRARGLGNIYHGLKNTGVSLDEAFSDFNDFLDKNPGELIIVLLRDESDGRYLFRKPQTATFTAALRQFLAAQPRVVNFRPDLRLRNCRGGIIVLCRTGSPSDMASTYLSWNHSIEGSRNRHIHYGGHAPAPLAVQDCYSPKSAAADCTDEAFPALKLAAAERFLHLAASQPGLWVINHVSAYVGTANYCRNAAYVNPRLARRLSASAGILMMDFAGVDSAKYRGKTYRVAGDSLLRAVIASNFRGETNKSGLTSPARPDTH